MTIDEAKEIVLTKEPIFLTPAKMIGRQRSYVCPHCNNGAKESKTGITMIPNTQNHPKYHCFSCGETNDIFDLAKEYYGFSNSNEVFNELYNFFGLDVNKKYNHTKENHSTTRITRSEEKKSVELRPQYENKMKYFDYVRKNLNPEYLKERGISEETQRHYWIGTDYHWRNPAVVKRFQNEGWPVLMIKETPRCIIPTDSQSYLARDIRKDIPEKEKKFAKLKYGAVPIFNQKFSSKENIIFVTEGEIDAISIYEVSKMEATGLGSTSNWRHLVEAAKQGGLFHGKVFVLLLDNDPSGKKTEETISEALKALGNEVIIGSIAPYKDPNEYLVNNREGFRTLIFGLLEKAKEKNRFKDNEREPEL